MQLANLESNSWMLKTFCEQCDLNAIDYFFFCLLVNAIELNTYVEFCVHLKSRDKCATRVSESLEKERRARSVFGEEGGAMLPSSHGGLGFLFWLSLSPFWATKFLFLPR